MVPDMGENGIKRKEDKITTTATTATPKAARQRESADAKTVCVTCDTYSL